MSELTDFFAETFTNVIEVVSKHPLESAAVATTIFAFVAGYGKGYHDGINNEREYKNVAIA